MIHSIYLTLKYSLLVIFNSARSKLTREKVDHYIQEWSTGIVDVVQLQYDVANPHKVEFSPQTKYILMSNHISHYDIPLIMLSIPGSIRMLAKKELFKVPIWGSAMRAAEFISIDRQNRAEAIKNLEYAKKKLESGIMLWVAPEGTRSRTGKLGNFKKGGFMLALQTGATIIPIGITGSADVLPAKTWNFKIKQHAKVKIGEPIDASKYTEEQRDELLKLVETQIRVMTGQDSQSND